MDHDGSARSIDSKIANELITPKASASNSNDIKDELSSRRTIAEIMEEKEQIQDNALSTPLSLKEKLKVTGKKI